MGLKDAALAVAFLLCLAVAANGFYLPGSYPVVREPGTGKKSELWAKVNSLTSIETELPYSYYSLPFCKPDRIGKDSENLGELLMGDRIENSPYKFLMQQTQVAVKLCVSDALREDEVKTLKQRIDDYYQVNLILDNLPAIRYTRAPDSQESFQWTGFPIGYYVPTKDSKDSKVYYINNHLQFKIKYHEYENSGKENIMSTGEGFDAVGAMEPNKTGAMVVGFEVQACSIKRDPAEADPLPKYSSLPAIECSSNGAHQEVKAHERIVFTYDVQWEKSDIRWPSRWDAYLKMEGAKVHWFSILNSLMVISFLAGIVFVIFLRTVRRDLTKYEELDKEAQAQMNEELSGWKLVVGDVFRPPTNSGLLCIMVGDGVQITGMAVVTILFAALGFMSPASRGMLLTGMVFLYLFLGVVAGYTAARLWKTLKGGDATGWRSISWRVASFFPGITFTILTLLNFLLWSKHSTGAIPLYLFFLLFAMWFGISVPLTLLGGFIGSKAEAVSFPVRTNQIPREVPPQKYPSWLLVLGAGTLPFGTLFIELFFILSSMWLNRVYYVFGFLFVVLVLLVIVCAEVSVVLTYMHLCVEDWRWWWKSFFASGSVALYVFLYSLNYFVFDLHSLKGPVSAVLYVGYSVLMVLAIMLATGTVGFLASFYFVHYLFSSVKLD